MRIPHLLIWFFEIFSFRFCHIGNNNIIFIGKRKATLSFWLLFHLFLWLLFYWFWLYRMYLRLRLRNSLFYLWFGNLFSRLRLSLLDDTWRYRLSFMFYWMILVTRRLRLYIGFRLKIILKLRLHSWFLSLRWNFYIWFFHILSSW